MKPAASTEKTGTKQAGYSGPEYAPFRCGNCQHFMSKSANGENDECWHPKVIADPEMKHDDDGHALVNKNGCCTYFRKGRNISHEKAKRLMAARSMVE